MTRAVLVLAALTLPVPALAQAYHCRVPDSIELPAPVQPDGPTVRAPIARYTLAVGWSPEFCRGDRATDPSNMQCSGRNGRFGFVLHGLWPETAKGPPPQWCALDPRPSREDYRANLCMTPVPWLLEHEWAKHGSCMATTPAAYFKVARILWQSLRLPDADRMSRKRDLTAGELRRAFVLDNPGWRAEAIGLVTSPGGWLREVHLCYGRSFRPAACPRRTLGPRDSVPLKIWRGL